MKTITLKNDARCVKRVVEGQNLFERTEDIIKKGETIEVGVPFEITLGSYPEGGVPCRYNGKEYVVFYDSLSSSLETREPVITVSRHHVASDPPIDIFNVQVLDEHGYWPETISTKEGLDIFLKGIRVGLAMKGIYVAFPEIPTKATATYSKIDHD